MPAFTSFSRAVGEIKALSRGTGAVLTANAGRTTLGILAGGFAGYAGSSDHKVRNALAMSAVGGLGGGLSGAGSLRRMAMRDLTAAKTWGGGAQAFGRSYYNSLRGIGHMGARPGAFRF